MNKQKKVISLVLGAVALILIGVSVFSSSGELQKGSLQFNGRSTCTELGVNECDRRLDCNWITAGSHGGSFCVEQGVTCSYTQPGLTISEVEGGGDTNPDTNSPGWIKFRINTPATMKLEIFEDAARTQTRRVAEITQPAFNIQRPFNQLDSNLTGNKHEIRWYGNAINSNIVIYEGLWPYRLTLTSTRDGTVKTFEGNWKVSRANNHVEKLHVSPTPFDPTIIGGQPASIEFTMTKAGHGRININSKTNTGSNPVKTFGTVDLATGVNRFTWDGKNNQGQQVPAGEYSVHVRPDNAPRTEPTADLRVIDTSRSRISCSNLNAVQCTQESNRCESYTSASTARCRDKGSGPAPFNLSGESAMPSTFVLGGSTDIKFSINYDAQVQVVIKNSAGTEVRSFAPVDYNVYRSRSDLKVTWDGKDGNNNFVAPGTYTFTINAVMNDGNGIFGFGLPPTDTFSGSVTISAPMCSSLAVTRRTSATPVQINSTISSTTYFEVTPSPVGYVGGYTWSALGNTTPTINGRNLEHRLTVSADGKRASFERMILFGYPVEVPNTATLTVNSTDGSGCSTKVNAQTGAVISTVNGSRTPAAATPPATTSSNYTPPSVYSAPAGTAAPSVQTVPPPPPASFPAGKPITPSRSKFPIYRFGR